jgi:hypothetical protein
MSAACTNYGDYYNDYSQDREHSGHDGGDKGGKSKMDDKIKLNFVIFYIFRLQIQTKKDISLGCKSSAGSIIDEDGTTIFEQTHQVYISFLVSVDN